MNLSIVRKYIADLAPGVTALRLPRVALVVDDSQQILEFAG